MIRFVMPMLLMPLFVSSAACSGENSKLRREMTDDSTWETSGGEEDWEKEHAPMPGEEPTSKGDPMQEFPRVTSGVIERHELIRVLDSGLGQYLRNIEMEPEFRKGSFVGFRIVTLFPGDLTYAALDLRPGDTVTRINGKPISRPEQASAVWKELRTASDLVVDYRRGDTDHTMRFVIVDAG